MVYFRSNKAKQYLSTLALRLMLIFSLSLIYFSSAISAREDATAIPNDIKQLFPSATRVGSADKNIAVTPVYQLSELLGYVFESDDFTNFIGFSGQTINLLIAIDPQGMLIKLKILDHHEPIFLHGLGEQPMIHFVDQYQGHSIKERIIIGRGSQGDSDATYFDGVTKATVSVLVINDTIITSALKVAREMLEGFERRVSRNIKSHYFERLSFQQLVDKGYLLHWHVGEQAALLQQPELAATLNALALDSEFVDMYLGFVNIPVIGRNLLGDEEYQRLLAELKPGEHALMLFNRGGYSFVDQDFIPQTVPQRLKVLQDGFPIDVRDIDFYSYYDLSFATDLSEFNQFKIFRIKSQSGFELSNKIDLSLAISYSQTFLTQKQHWFQQTISLPDYLFEQAIAIEPVEIMPLWQRVWRNRLTEILLLSAYLVFVLTLFIRPAQWARKPKRLMRLRLGSLIFCLAFIGVYAQGQLSVVNIYTLLLSLGQGFNLEVFLLDPMIFILWLFVSVTLFIWGRGLFCGWLCPFGALQELVAMLGQKLSIKQIKIKPQYHDIAKKSKYIILVLLIASAFYSLTIAEQLAEIEPFKTSITLLFVRYWPFVLYALALLALGLKIHKFYCRYLCPLGAGLAILGRWPLKRWIRRREECGSPCQLCSSKKCAIAAIDREGAVDYRECVGCFECVVTIEDPKLCVIDKYAPKPVKSRRKDKVISLELSS